MIILSPNILTITIYITDNGISGLID